MHRRSDPNAQPPDPLAGDPSATIIWDMVETIVREAHPLAVILFGSRAQSTHRPTSDADLLVVVLEGTDTRQAAAAIDNRLPFAGVDVDIVAATPSRLVAARGDYSSVLHWAQERGVTLYEDNSAGTPPSSAIPAASKAT